MGTSPLLYVCIVTKALWVPEVLWRWTSKAGHKAQNGLGILEVRRLYSCIRVPVRQVWLGCEGEGRKVT